MISTLFDISDASGNVLYTKIHISPIDPPLTYNGSIIAADPVLAKDLKSAAAYVPLVPGNYLVQFVGKITRTEFTISLPSSIDNTTASAAAYVVNYDSDYENNTTASFAISAGNGMTAFSSNGAGTSPTGSLAYPVGGAIDSSTGRIWWWYLGQWN